LIRLQKEGFLLTRGTGSVADGFIYCKHLFLTGEPIMSNEQMLKETTTQLREFLVTKNVLGEPVVFGEKVVVPVARYGFAFGAGGNNGKEGSNQGAGGGGGIEPVALIVLHRDVKGAEGIQIMSLKKDSAIAQAISAIGESLAPQVISAIKSLNENAKVPATDRKEEP
jgi:uncharacterized spore protein YtfJ